MLGLGEHTGEPADGGNGHAVSHRDLFATWTWTSDAPLSYGSVRDVLGSLPSAVYRAKGFLYLSDAPEQRVVAHVVGRRVDLRPSGSWGDAEPRTELVFVSLEQSVDAAGIADRLAATAVTHG